jgi:replicative DNA helicase
VSEQIDSVEKTLLGMILRDGKLIRQAIVLDLKAEMFSCDKCRRIFSAMIECDLENREIDLASVGIKIPAAEIPDMIALAEGAPIAASFSHWANELKTISFQKYFGQEIHKIGLKIFNRKPFEKIDDLKKEFEGISSRFFASEQIATTQSACELLIDYTQVLETRMENFKNGNPRGLKTGFKKIDAHVQGFCPGRLYVIAARPSIGKTTFAINLLENFIKQQRVVAFFSGEMSNIEIIEKLLSCEARIDSSLLMNGALSNDQASDIMSCAIEIAKSKTFFNSRFGRSIEVIQAEARQLKKSHELDAIVVDYLQLMQCATKKFTNRYAEVSYISGVLKMLALDLDIPVITLAQINRDAANSMPQLHHIKDSGSIEQDADVVMMLHEENIDEKKRNWLIVAKNRFGKKGSIELTVDFALNKFFEMEF